MVEPVAPNKLYFGDNLPILREHIADASVDLIYLDPPFNSNANYNILFRERSGEQSAAQITAFRDTWRWSIESEAAYLEVIQHGPQQLARLLAAMRDFLGQNDMMAYLTMMAQRMIEMHRVLKPTGSIYLHCDPTAGHYLKTLMDSVFGARNFINEISWQRSQNRSAISRRFRRAHDLILFYGRGTDYRFTMQYRELSAESQKLYSGLDERGYYRLVPLLVSGRRGGVTGMPWRGIDPNEQGRDGMHWVTVHDNLEDYDADNLIHWPAGGGLPNLKYYMEDSPGSPMSDYWYDIRPIQSRSRESLGYPTQKPEALLERIIRAGSSEGDLVLDPFCGCGTAMTVAERLNRRWIGIDITHLAVSLMKNRLRDNFGDNLRPYDLIGVPQDVASARALAVESEHDGRYQFEWWALGLVDARPARERRRGADSGVDGYINFFDDNSGRPKRIIVQVKSGQVNRGQIAALKGDMKRERAEIALFITLNPPTSPMGQEAAAAGFYQPEHFPGQQFPRVQILTIEELLNGKLAEYPRYAPEATFQRAPRRTRAQGAQIGFSRVAE